MKKSNPWPRLHVLPLGRWALLLGSLGLLLLTSCQDATDIGLDMQTSDTTTGSFYVDTFTVRTRTVLLDSVPTSTSSYLMAGRYTHPQVGAVEARSFLQLGLESAFVPTTTAVYDSLVLVLQADAYRYGDTTRTQHLVVNRLSEDFSPTQIYYTGNTLAYTEQPLATKTLRARAGARAIRIALPAALGKELMTLGRAGTLSTAAELAYYLKGLTVGPATTDDAALVRFLVSTSALNLYYHETGEPTTVLTQRFALSARHFYQLRANRQATLLAGLTATRQALPSNQTAEETFVQGGLGLYTKIELPYLLELPNLGGTSIISSARLELEATTSTTSPYLPPPVALTLRQTDQANRLGTLFTVSDGTAQTLPYVVGQSARTGLQEGSYSIDLTSYLNAVLRRTTANNGLLLCPLNTESPEQVALGSFRNTSHPLRLRIYYTKTN